MFRASPYLRQESINDHGSFNAYYTQVLNPKAWARCPTNSVCAARPVLYKDFRGPRIPSENFNIGRHFRVGKEDKYDFYIRGEFVDIFNRTLFATPAGFIKGDSGLRCWAGVPLAGYRERTWFRGDGRPEGSLLVRVGLCLGSVGKA